MAHTPVKSRVDPRIVAEQVAMLYRMAPHALALSAIGVTVVAALFLEVAETRPLVLWFAVCNLIVVARVLLVRMYHRAKPAMDEAVRWGRYFSYSAFCGGLAWGLLG